jgi:hypothetical protein
VSAFKLDFLNMSLDGLEKGRDYNLKAALTFAESTACPEK